MSISRFILKLLGWKAIYTVELPQKSVVATVPHTSNWDFIFGKLFAKSVGLNSGFLIKKSWFVFPLNYIFKAMDGVPVDRTKNTSVVEQMISAFNTHETFHLAITPEGSRKRKEEWKLGFYYIALGAKVPIQLAYFNYDKKIIAIEEIFTPTGDKEKDLEYIFNYYRQHGVAKKPENFAIPQLS